MANELRVRTGSLGGLIEDNPLTSVATTLTSAALAAMPSIGTTQHMAILLDPDGIAGAPEIAYVTAHVAAATTATILRGQESSVARAHERDTTWIHGPTVKDFDASGGGVGLIGLTNYNPVGTVAPSTSSATYADIDATNLVVTFTTPPSGRILVRLTGRGFANGANCDYAWNLRESTSDITDSGAYVLYSAATSTYCAFTHVVQVTGLTTGSHSYKWGHARMSGASTCGLQYGGGIGAAVMEVWAVNV